MEKSIYADLIGRIFPQLGNLVQKVNEKRKGAQELTYLHKTMLRKEYSPDQKWESASVNSKYVSADMVAMDSPIPIKSRPSLRHADGTIPKIAVGYTMKESQMNAINIMRAQGRPWQEVAAKLTEDPIACSVALDEKNEKNYLEAISKGYCTFDVLNDQNNAVELLRVDFKFPEKNIFGVEKAGSVGRDDIENILSKIKDNLDSVEAVMIDKSTYNAMRKTRWAKELVADSEGRIYTDNTVLPVPNSKRFDEAFKDEYGVSFIVVDRTIREEHNGKERKIRPFDKNRLVFLPSSGVQGALVYGRLAEADHPVGGAQYSIVDEYKLIARYRTGDPLIEKTTGQAMVIPVIENVDLIYILDLNLGGQVVNDTEEAKDSTDQNVTVWGATYTKAGVIEELGKLDIECPSNASDKVVIDYINSLSKGEQTALKKACEGYKTT